MTDMKYKKIIFPIILLIVCWIFNFVDCLLSSSIEVSIKNIVTLKSFTSVHLNPLTFA